MPEDREELPPLDEEWIQAAAHREESAEVRADRYARINSGHQQVQAGDTSWRSAPAKSSSSGLSLTRWVLAIVGILAAIIFVVWLLDTGRPLVDDGPIAFVGDDTTSETLGSDTARQLQRSDFPTAGIDAEPSRILAEVQPPADPGQYDFLAETGGQPVTYSPCRNLEVVVNPRGGPPGSVTAVEQAVDQIRAASGLSISVSGETDETYQRNRDPVQVDRYGDRWAPILVTWTEADEVPQFSEAAVGLGGSLSVRRGDSPPSYVTGDITLNREYFSEPTTGGLLREVLLHEFGHVLGLGHVDDPEQVMTREARGGRPLGSGDLAGLALLGQGPCTPKL
ncbi:MAG: hypothetical protein CMH41_04065 [Micrococcales bacterium]|nr:hypothetical protein [Micrococcales bacterium]